MFNRRHSLASLVSLYRKDRNTHWAVSCFQSTCGSQTRYLIRVKTTAAPHWFGYRLFYVLIKYGETHNVLNGLCADFSYSPFATKRLLGLHRLLLWLEAEVLDINAEMVVKQFEEGVGQSVFRFVWGEKRKVWSGSHLLHVQICTEARSASTNVTDHYQFLLLTFTAGCRWLRRGRDFGSLGGRVFKAVRWATGVGGVKPQRWSETKITPHSKEAHLDRRMSLIFCSSSLHLLRSFSSSCLRDSTLFSSFSFLSSSSETHESLCDHVLRT